MKYKEIAYNMLRQQALSDSAKAKTSLKMLLDHPAGVGEHSTGDLYDNLNQSLSLLADAEDKLNLLTEYEEFFLR
tara:strand:- start:144 stop:368 length:225 start_codon:yes stop_codon:yes gene_type:complete